MLVFQHIEVLIPSSSGLSFKRRLCRITATLSSLNPFFIRSVVQTDNGHTIDQLIDVLIPSSSGLSFKHSDGWKYFIDSVS